jgi:hypothetical protein
MKSLVLLAAALTSSQAAAHDIYTNLLGSGGIRCCGGESAGPLRDCWRTVYRERGPDFDFRLQNGDWVSVPRDRIQFTPIPGDVEDGERHRAHLCYSDHPRWAQNHLPCCDHNLTTVGGAQIVFFCAFIPPGHF